MNRDPLKSRLASWLEAGLISQEQSEKIQAFERARTDQEGGHPINILAVLAAFSVALGIISLIAANWHFIPGSIKLSAYFGIISLLGFYLVKLEKTQSLLAEALPVSYLLLILAGIGLVSQIYHLKSDGWQGLALWSLLGMAPTLRLQRSYTTYLWLISLLSAVITYVFHRSEGLPLRLDLFFLSCSMIALLSFDQSYVRLPLSFRPSIRAFTIPIIFIIFPYFSGKIDKLSHNHHDLLVYFTLAVTWIYLPWFRHTLSPIQRILVAIGLAAFSARTLLIMHLGLDHLKNWVHLIEAISAIIQATAMAILALQFDKERLFHQLCFLMFLRIGYLSLSLFGSLLFSGMGLIALGIGLLLLLRSWQKNHHKILIWLRELSS